jgi:uncharacterized protein DUF4832/uncharacterized protein DUF4874
MTGTRTRRRRLAGALVVGIVGLTGLAGPATAGASERSPVAAAGHKAVVTYEPTDEVIANPERGFYHFPLECDKADFDAATLRQYRDAEQITQVMCVFYLSEFKTGPISQAALDQFQQQADTIRAAGLKTILRFAYTQSPDGDDAAPAVVLGHLDQLRPYLERNSDVIAVVQAGFIGAWGEWWYTQNFGNEGTVTPADWANRKAVVDKLLSVLPDDRMVQVRTPYYKRTMYGLDPLPPGQAYDGSANARVGHHNDCFLASPDDFGTYRDPDVEYPYLAAETRFLAMGGETCNPNPPRSECPTALHEMGLFHYSYMNIDYRQEVLDSWTSGGCMTDVRRRLGYRFTLTEGTFPDSASPGGALPVRLTLTNHGWAAPYNPRPVNLVLRNTSTGAVHGFPLVADARPWAPGQTVTVNRSISLPADLPAGTYALLLDLPDPSPGLSARAEYKIRLANNNLWEPATGYNDLRHTVSVR